MSDKKCQTKNIRQKRIQRCDYGIKLCEKHIEGPFTLFDPALLSSVSSHDMLR
jgi:hypothetical protein